MTTLTELGEMLKKMNWNFHSCDDSSRWKRWDQHLMEMSRLSDQLRRQGEGDEVQALWKKYKR